MYFPRSYYVRAFTWPKNFGPKWPRARVMAQNPKTAPKRPKMAIFKSIVTCYWIHIAPPNLDAKFEAQTLSAVNKYCRGHCQLSFGTPHVHVWIQMAEKMAEMAVDWLANIEKPVFRVLWAPEALNDTTTENKKQPNFDKNCFVFSV